MQAINSKENTVCSSEAVNIPVKQTLDMGDNSMMFSKGHQELKL